MTDDNDLAFPAFDKYNNIADGGLTKREYFSAMALQGVLACYYGKNLMPERLAIDSVIYADALIEQLNKIEKP